MRMRVAALVVALMLVNGSAIAEEEGCDKIIGYYVKESQPENKPNCEDAKEFVKGNIKGCLMFYDSDKDKCTGSAKHWVESWEKLKSIANAGSPDPSVSKRPFWSVHVPFSKSTTDYLDEYYLGSIAESGKRR